MLFQLVGNSTFGYIETHSLFRWMYSAYLPSHEGAVTEDSHGAFIPFVVLGIFWWRRKELIAVPLKAWWPSLLLLMLGLLLHAAGFAIQQPRVSIIGLFIGLYGLTGMAWGPRWLQASFFPFFLFAFMVPLGSQALPITFRLQMLVCQIVEGICHNLLTIDILRQGTALIDPSGRYHYEVVAACSGIRSLITTLLLSIVYGMFSFQTWWRRGLMVASAFPLAVLGNVLRLLTIVIAAELFGQNAGSWAHENFVISLLPYVPMFLGLMGIGHWLRERETGKPLAPKEIETPPTT